MCGICGEVTFSDAFPVSPERVRAMASRLSHRGPDGDGLWHEPGVAFGHRRLSILDLSPAAAQPMHSPDGRFVIAYNGEVYNFRELRSELEALGERFSTTSDTEVLLRALARWGVEAVRRMDGMWAFALWDRREQSLLLCRDDLGIKPLYWAPVPDGLVFSSEIPPLLLHPTVSREINTRSLAEQVACRYVLAPRTLFKDIRKLPPGHSLTLKDGHISVAPYYRLPVGELIQEMSDGQALERFTEALDRAVRMRLVSDVPVGMLLSGGVDSTAVASAMKAAAGDRVATFTVGFEGAPRHDERAWATRAANHLGTDHHEVVISPADFVREMPAVLSHLDDPVADLAVLPLYFVCRAAREKVTVLLTGQGADEILGGYHLDRVLRQMKAILKLRGMPGAQRLAAAIARRDPRRGYLARWDDIRDADPSQLPAKMRYDLTLPLGPDRMASLLKDPTREPYDPVLDAHYSEVPSHRGPLDAILSVLCKGWLPDNLLNHGDRMSMAHSVELRVPFLAPDLVRFCWKLPERLKISGGTTKVLLKEYAEAKGIPSDLIHRPKKGFPVPWDDWLRGPLATPVREVLDGATWMGDHFHRGAIPALLEEHRRGADVGLVLWNLTVLARWGENLLRG
jgi:asparagine synthase (glutamine-hydrolysing)